MVVSPNVAVMLCGIWGLLINASIFVWLFSKFKPLSDHNELIQRTKSWWFILGLFTIALVTNHTIYLLFFGFVSFLALKEFFSIIPTRRVDRRILFWAYLAIPFQFYWIGIGWFGMFITFIPVFMFLFIPFRLLLSKQTQGFLKAVGTIQWGLMITVFALSHMAYLVELPNLGEIPMTGVGLLLYLVFLTQFNDVAQYLCGKLFGKNKILPTISPKKTWEGLIGGIIITTLFSVLIYRIITPFTLCSAMLTGLIISVAGFVGDVTISAIKRDLEVKDTSNLIPGHGGVLDRVDSLTYTAPLFFHFVYYYYY